MCSHSLVLMILSRELSQIRSLLEVSVPYCVSEEDLDQSLVTVDHLVNTDVICSVVSLHFVLCLAI